MVGNVTDLFKHSVLYLDKQFSVRTHTQSLCLLDIYEHGPQTYTFEHADSCWKLQRIVLILNLKQKEAMDLIN